MPEPTSDAWTQIRYDYEHSSRPIVDICAEHGISANTLRDRVRRWRWNRRRAPIPREGPPALPPRDIVSPPPVRAANGGEGSGVGGLGADRTADPPTPLRLADASRSDPPHRFAGGGMELAALPPNASGIEDGRGCEGDTGGAAASDPAAIAPRLQSAVARVLPAIETIIARLSAGPLAPREMEQTARALGVLTRTLRELNALLAQHQTHAAVPYDDMPEDQDAFRDDLARQIDLLLADEAEEAAAEPVDGEQP